MDLEGEGPPIPQYFLCPGIKDTGAYSPSVCLSVFLSEKNFNIEHNFWTEGDRALIFHMCIPCDKTFQLIPIFFYLVTLTFDLINRKCS